MTPRLILQPEGSSLCGQCVVAMAAGVSLEEAEEAVGHDNDSGTGTREIVEALRDLGVACADHLKRVPRARPVLPKRAIVVIHSGNTLKPRRWHWMLHWDGDIYDPGGQWPNYTGWRITSALEIFER